MHPTFARLCTLCLLLGLLAACGSDKKNPQPDAEADMAEDLPQDSQGPDAADDAQDTPEDLSQDSAPDVEDTGVDLPRPEPGSRVEVDLTPYLGGGDGGGAPRVFVARSPEDLLEGTNALGRLGDHVMENDKVRLVIEGDDRAIGPCPWGGTVLDVASRSAPDQAWGPDVQGEICLMVNVGRTLKPDLFEVLHDGSQGAAVLAVTGHLELLDFIHLVGMASGFANVNLELPVDPDAELPLTVTTYYILRAGDQGVRVITALRNDGDEETMMAISHLMNSGGPVSFFNPLNEYGGFGYKSIGADNLQSTPLPFLAFQGDQGGFAYVPKPVEGFEFNGLPLSGSYLSISGVAVSWLGVLDMLAALLTPVELLARGPGVLTLAPGQQDQVEHWHLVGDGSLSTMVDTAYEHLGVSTEPFTGHLFTTVGDQAQPAAGALVSAVNAQGDTLNQARCDENGDFSMRVPAGVTQVQVLWRGRTLQQDATVGQPLELELQRPGKLRVQVQTPTGDPTPARVTLSCDGGCPEAPTSQLRDVTIDRPGGSAGYLVGFAGVDGLLELELAPGNYKVAVSRGLEWSVWPSDSAREGGQVIEIQADQELLLEAEIAQVVDTADAISGDFHVHSEGSPDSPISHLRRVQGFLADGVDVLVSTDHDVIADLNPTIEELGAQEQITNVIGVELTTANYGHYNSFPLVRDPASRNGGAVDWAGGAGPGQTPAEIFASLREFPGEQVIQINHPEGPGGIGALRADVLRGLSYTPAQDLRLAPREVDPETGDTGLWSDDFTAMEIMNGLGTRNLWQRWRWWTQMLGRGLRITGTAVTDTHRVLSNPNGTPRTYVFMDPAQAQPGSLDRERFAQAINQGRALGTNGPFFHVTARNAQGEQASPGDTLSTGGQPITLEVRYDLPAWLEINRVELYTNLRDQILTQEPGQASGDRIEPQQSVTVDLSQIPLSTVATGAAVHQHRTGAVQMEVEAPQDAYLIVVLRGAGNQIPSMFPVVYGHNIKPFAFSNPVYLDADGDGYNHYPLADLASSPPPAQEKAAPQEPLRGEEALRWLLEHNAHSHDHEE